MGSLRYHFPICLVERWSCLDVIRNHSSRLWSHIRFSVSSRTGFHVWAMAAHILDQRKLTCNRDPAVGAQYRWAARFAPAAPRFWGLIQGWLTIFAWITGG